MQPKEGFWSVRIMDLTDVPIRRFEQLGVLGIRSDRLNDTGIGRDICTVQTCTRM